MSRLGCGRGSCHLYSLCPLSVSSLSPSLSLSLCPLPPISLSLSLSLFPSPSSPSSSVCRSLLCKQLKQNKTQQRQQHKDSHQGVIWGALPTGRRGSHHSGTITCAKLNPWTPSVSIPAPIYIMLWWAMKIVQNRFLGPVSQNLSSVTNDSLCYKLLKSLLLIGYQQIYHGFLSFVIEKGFVKRPLGHG